MQISFEFFPPRKADSLQKLSLVKQTLLELDPEYFSVTFGAGGTTQDATLNTVTQFRQDGTVVAPHFSCIGSDKENIIHLLSNYKTMGVKKVLALRGDVPSGMRDIGDFHYAVELVEFIKKHFDDYFTISVAAYPEKHPQAKSINSDIDNLIHKFEKGASSAITQYFYNIEAFLYFRDEVAKRSDNKIIPGIMPITNYESLMRFSNMCGAQIPRWIANKLEVYKNNQESLNNFGFDIVNNLCQNLKQQGVNDFHFYTMNRSKPSYFLAKNLL